MTLQRILAGRMVLMRAQRHISQAEWDGVSPGLDPQFKTVAGDRAFFTVERLLVDLETEFDKKKSRCSPRRRRQLDRLADKQVQQ